jgi:hypothetical protein
VRLATKAVSRPAGSFRPALDNSVRDLVAAAKKSGRGGLGD